MQVKMKNIKVLKLIILKLIEFKLNHKDKSEIKNKAKYGIDYLKMARKKKLNFKI